MTSRAISSPSVWTIRTLLHPVRPNHATDHFVTLPKPWDSPYQDCSYHCVPGCPARHTNLFRGFSVHGTCRLKRIFSIPTSTTSRSSVSNPNLDDLPPHANTDRVSSCDFPGRTKQAPPNTIGQTELILARSYRSDVTDRFASYRRLSHPAIETSQAESWQAGLFQQCQLVTGRPPVSNPNLGDCPWLCELVRADPVDSPNLSNQPALCNPPGLTKPGRFASDRNAVTSRAGSVRSVGTLSRICAVLANPPGRAIPSHYGTIQPVTTSLFRANSFGPYFTTPCHHDEPDLLATDSDHPDRTTRHVNSMRPTPRDTPLLAGTTQPRGQATSIFIVRANTLASDRDDEPYQSLADLVDEPLLAYVSRPQQALNTTSDVNTASGDVGTPHDLHVVGEIRPAPFDGCRRLVAAQCTAYGAGIHVSGGVTCAA